MPTTGDDHQGLEDAFGIDAERVGRLEPVADRAARGLVMVVRTHGVLDPRLDEPGQAWRRRRSPGLLLRHGSILASGRPPATTCGSTGHNLRLNAPQPTAQRATTYGSPRRNLRVNGGQVGAVGGDVVPDRAARHGVLGGLVDWIRKTVLSSGKVSEKDVDLLQVTDSVEEAVAIMTRAETEHDRATGPGGLPAITPHRPD